MLLEHRDGNQQRCKITLSISERTGPPLALGKGRPGRGSMLDQLIRDKRAEIIARTRAKVVARSNCRPADVRLGQGIPVFLDDLSETLSGTSSQAPTMSANAARHGRDLMQMGFSVSQLIHGYGDVCQAVTELALDCETPISMADFRALNCCLDEAIASAVTEYQLQREARLSRQGAERLGVLAHELRNALSGALLAFGTLRRGIGPDNKTGAILNRSLSRLRDLIDRSVSEVRLEAGVVHYQRLIIADLIRDVLLSAATGAAARGVSLEVVPMEAQLEVEADRHLLIGAVENLLQNAFKFTCRGGRVSLKVHQTEGQLLIGVEDECGGLPPGKTDQLFDAFEQHGADRSGLGLGLWISRASLQAMGGKLCVLDLPGKGCIFTAALPRLPRGVAIAASESALLRTGTPREASAGIRID
jgi:signal transduction histidine kinase